MLQKANMALANRDRRQPNGRVQVLNQNKDKLLIGEKQLIKWEKRKIDKNRKTKKEKNEIKIY